MDDKIMQQKLGTSAYLLYFLTNIDSLELTRLIESMQEIDNIYIPHYITDAVRDDYSCDDPFDVTNVVYQKILDDANQELNELLDLKSYSLNKMVETDGYGLDVKYIMIEGKIDIDVDTYKSLISYRLIKADYKMPSKVKYVFDHLDNE